MRRLSELFSTLLNVGFLPYAPGTIASAITVTFWYIFIQFFPIYMFVLFVLMIAIFSIYLVNIYMEDLLSEDPSEVVVDEFIGQSIPLMFLTHNSEIFEILFAFICFRIFDIYKIYPVNLGEKMKGSIGVIADDIIAGIYTVIFLMIYRIIFY